MEWFYFITIVIAIVLLIITLTFIGTRMAGSKKGNDKAFPPVKNSCPDLWEADVDDDNKTWCKVPESSNKGNITDYTTVPGYSTRNGTGQWVNFNSDDWNTGSGTTECAKTNWARANSISWDGVSNYNQCE